MKRLAWIAICICFLAGCCLTGSKEVMGCHRGAARGNVLPGIDVLAKNNFDVLAGKRVGLITNQTGINRDGVSDIDVLYNSGKVNLVALFSPEHGIRGVADENVDSGKDETTGLPIFSLYGKTKKPTKEMLENLDVLVFDLQDIGTRFYTYMGTMAMVMQAAKEFDKEVVVLDRPNTIGGVKVEGAVPEEKDCGGLTSIYPIPTRHGMTMGELAKMFNEHFGIGCRLTVVPLENWKRRMYFDETGLLWVNPSPNMKTMNGAIFYPGLGVSETSVSVGRGLDRPFEMYGAPFFDGKKIAENLSKRNIPGVRFVPYSFTPTAKYHRYKDELCQGVFAILFDRDKLDSSLAGLHMIQAFYECHPDQYKVTDGLGMTGDKTAWDKLTQQKLTPEEVVATWKPKVDEYMKIRAKYLMYK